MCGLQASFFLALGSLPEGKFKEPLFQCTVLLCHLLKTAICLSIVTFKHPIQCSLLWSPTLPSPLILHSKILFNSDSLHIIWLIHMALHSLTRSISCRFSSTHSNTSSFVTRSVQSPPRPHFHQPSYVSSVRHHVIAYNKILHTNTSIICFF